MVPDPRWLEILKASGWQLAAGAAACGLFLLFARWQWVPALAPWMTQLAVFGLLLFGLLTIASMITAALKFFPVQTWIVHWVGIRRSKRGLQSYIAFMTPKEREIIAHLLHHNQKTFTADMDGGYASTLLARGIVLIVARPGQQVDQFNVPMTIPDPLWEVLEANREKFPFTGPDEQDDEHPGHPWRIPWMAR